MHKIKLPSIHALSEELARIKRLTDFVFIANVNEDHTHSDWNDCTLQVTLGFDWNGYALQTGDNSYTGSAYSFRFWAVDYLAKNSNCRELAKDILKQAREYEIPEEYTPSN